MPSAVLKRIYIYIVHKFICVSVFLLFSTTLRGQEFYFEHLGNDKQLSFDACFALFQDAKGFIWIGTGYGLNKYDGYEITSFFEEPGNPNSLSNNYINCITEDGSGNLWIGTKNGLNRLNLKTNKFTRYYHHTDKNSIPDNEILSLEPDSNNGLWVGTINGFCYFDLDNDTITNYYDSSDPEHKQERNIIYRLHLSGNGKLWVGTHYGVKEFDPGKKEFRFFDHDPDDPNTIPGTRAYCFYEEDEENLWIGTNSGIAILNRKTNNISVWLNRIYNKDIKYLVTVKDIAEDNFGRLWIASQGNGLIVYDRQTKEFTFNGHSNEIPHSISWDVIYSLLKDRQGTMWIATYGKGVDYLNPSAKKFEKYSIKDKTKKRLGIESVINMYLDSHNELWVAGFGESRLDRIDMNNNSEVRRIKGDLRGIYVTAVAGDKESGDRYIWLGTTNANYQLIKFDRVNEKIIEKYDFRNIINHFGIEISQLKEDNIGNIWLSSDDGLIKFNKKTKKNKIFTGREMTPGLTDDAVQNLYLSSDNTLWIATQEGVYLLDPSNDRITEFHLNKLLSSQVIYSFAEDQNGAMWIGTLNGLMKYEKGSDRLKYYSTADGLASSMIAAIEIDNSGNVWLSSNNGLSMLNPHTGAVKTFDVSDGIQNKSFNIGASFRSRKGELFFGGVEGLNYFHPENIKYNETIPDVCLTDFLISNKSVKIGSRSGNEFVLDNSITYTDELNIPNNINVISFKFACLNFLLPHKNKFAYKLEGFEENWNYVGDRRFVTYTSLPPGEYIFRVIASNNDGAWNRQGASLKISIPYHFYQTWWFYLLLSVALLFIIYLSVKFRTMQIKRRNLHLEEKIAKRTEDLNLLNLKLKDEIEERVTIERELLNYKDNLEHLVNDRTKELNNEISERKKIEKDLIEAKYKAERSEKIKTEFLAQMSHEIRTPINTILNFASLIKDGIDVSSNDDLKDSFEVIESAGNRTVRTIDMILNMSEIQTGTYEFQLTEFDIYADVLKKIRDEFFHLASNKKLEFEIINKTGNTVINADQYSISQILVNLVDNAIKYTKAGSVKVIVETGDDKRLTVSVTDTGIGISKEYLPNLFQPFSQEEQGYSRKFEGNGLGLALVKKYCDMNNAEISVESIKNQGSTFKVVFPIQDKNA